MKKAGVLAFVTGFALGALVFGGTMAVAAGIVARPKTADVIIDGAYADLKGYIIDGSHYFQLRDLSDKLKPGGKDFSVAWDGVNNRILIDTHLGYEQNEGIPTPKTDIDPEMSIAEMKMETVRLANIERVKAGLPELAVMPELMGCAQLKADDMLENRYFGHVSPKYGSANDMIRVLVPGYRSACENINIGGTTPADVIEGWMVSDVHRSNLLHPQMAYVGVGVVSNKVGTLIWVLQLMRT